MTVYRTLCCFCLNLPVRILITNIPEDIFSLCRILRVERRFLGPRMSLKMTVALRDKDFWKSSTKAAIARVTRISRSRWTEA